MSAHLAWLFREGRDGLRQLPERSEAVGRLVRRIRGSIDRLDGREDAPKDPTAELIDLIDRSCQRHVHHPYEGDVLVLHGDACPKSVFIEPTFGWGGSVIGQLRIHRVKGEHLEIWKGRSLRDMSVTIAETLASRYAGEPVRSSRRIVLSEQVDPPDA